MKRSIAMIFALIVAMLLLVSAAIDGIEALAVAVLAMIIGIVGVLPLMLLLSKPIREFPLFASVSCGYGIAFGFSYFLPREASANDPTWFPENQINAYLIVLAGLILMHIGYRYTQPVFKTVVNPIAIPDRWGELLTLKLLAYFMVALNTLSLMWPDILEIPTLGTLLGSTFAIIGFSIVIVLWMTKKIGRIEAICIASIVVPFNVVPRLISGLLAELLVLFALYIFLGWRIRERFPWTAVLLSLILFFVLSPIKHEIRYQTWSYITKDTELSFSEKVKIGADILSHYTESSTSSPISPIEALANRMNLTITLARVIYDTPNHVPYWGGETYAQLFAKAIPRFLWPGKPVEKTGNDFGQRYGYLDADDERTSYNLPWIVEMYANFGSIGTLVGMLLVGMLYALVDRALNLRGSRALDPIFSCSVLISFIYHETYFAGMLSGVLAVVFWFSVTFWIASKFAPRSELVII